MRKVEKLENLSFGDVSEEQAKRTLLEKATLAEIYQAMADINLRRAQEAKEKASKG